MSKNDVLFIHFYGFTVQKQNGKDAVLFSVAKDLTLLADKASNIRITICITTTMILQLGYFYMRNAEQKKIGIYELCRTHFPFSTVAVLPYGKEPFLTQMFQPLADEIN